MGHIFSAISPCELTPKGRRDAERLYPGLRFPDEGRLPSRAEIEATLAAHPEWQVELDTGKGWWTAFIRSPTLTASLRVDGYSGELPRPHSFYFDTGDPDLVVDVVAAIAERCGPFLVVDESGEVVILVMQDGSREDIGQGHPGDHFPGARNS